MSKILFTGVSCLLAAALVVSAPTQKYVESQLVYYSGYLEAGRKSKIYLKFPAYSRKIQNSSYSTDIGDRLLQTHQFVLDDWPTPQNITFPIRFPQNGKKIIVTYVTAVSDQVNVEQILKCAKWIRI